MRGASPTSVFGFSGAGSMTQQRSQVESSMQPGARRSSQPQSASLFSRFLLPLEDAVFPSDPFSSVGMGDGRE